MSGLVLASLSLSLRCLRSGVVEIWSMNESEIFSKQVTVVG